MAFTFRRLGPSDAAAYRVLRLAGLRDHPEAFGAAWAEEEAQPLAWFAERLARLAVFGGFGDDGALLGIAGLLVAAGAKSRHKGVLWGMQVAREARGTGLAAALVAQVIAHAAGLVEQVTLSVGATNVPALRLYTQAGFRGYGLERRALRVGDAYHDEVLMALPLPAPAPPGRGP